MKKQFDAVIAGYTCVDLTPEFRKDSSATEISDLLKPGKLIEIGGLGFNFGGVVPNTGLAMKKFGKKVFLNGLMGNDFIGRIAAIRLSDYGISEGMMTTGEVNTGYSLVLAP